MFGKRELRQIVLCVGLAIAAMAGANVRPEEMEDLLREGQRARLECSSQQENKNREGSGTDLG